MKKFLSVVCAALFATSTAEAVYEASSDTGTEIFDFIENRRREEREQKLTPEQEKLLSDIEEAKAQLPHEPKEGDPVPAVFEGDDLVYYSGSGEFIATGKVDILQLAGYRFQSKEAAGNVKEQFVYVDGKAHVLQLTEGAPRVTLDGYKTYYNYGKKTGTMESANGKMGEYYLTGKRFEFYPDHIVVYDGTQTKCGAKSPDYHLSAERMEIWPEQVVRMYNVKFWIKNKVVATKDYEERTLGEKEKNYFPRVGYNSDHGVYIRDNFKFPIAKHWDFLVGAHIETKKGIRSNAEIFYANRELKGCVKYGFYDDSDARWIQKEPSLDIWYEKHIDNSSLSYRIEGEFGHWRQDSIASTHQEYELNLYHDPIELGKYYLLLHTGYKITKDDVKGYKKNIGDTTVRGFKYHAYLAREFDERLAAYVGFSYDKNTSQNSLFDFDNDDYSRKFQAGVSYWLTPKDRVVVGVDWNADKHTVKDVDYYWYHDLHCSQAVLRWRGKRRKLEVHWEFVPW